MIIKAFETIPVHASWRFTFWDFSTGKSEVIEKENVVTTIGKGMIARSLGGLSISDGKPYPDYIRYVAVGTGAGVPAVGDSTLSTELATGLGRVSVAASTISGNQIIISGFFSELQGNGTLTNAGLFGGQSATTTKDSGLLFNHVAISRVKTNTETMIVEVIITIG
jgi:hypothetical protein